MPTLTLRSLLSPVAIPLVALLLTATPAAADHHENAESPKAKAIFDGQTLNGWEGDETFWRVEDGAIVGQSTDENPCEQTTYLRWTGGTVDDFELTFQIRLSGGGSANSGMQFRSAVKPNGQVAGYQADINKAGQYVGMVYDQDGRGIICPAGQTVVYTDATPKISPKNAVATDAVREAFDPDGWNTYRVLARGNHIRLFINDTPAADLTDNDTANQDFSGVLAIQLHQGPPMKVEVKDVRLKRLPLEKVSSTGLAVPPRRKIVFLGGTNSHGAGAHEFNAGSRLLAGELNATQEAVLATVVENGWPADPTFLDNVDCLVVGANGQGGHPLLKDPDAVEAALAGGMGLVCWHYAVEPTPQTAERFRGWLGGNFEQHYSVNPFWTAKIDDLPSHAVTRGVGPFELRDEWYYHMRFVDGMQGVTPVLTTLPPRETLSREDGPHSNNPAVREAVLQNKEPQTLAWAYQRPGDFAEGRGRSFGFTGGHLHSGWANDDVRTLMLNAAVWAAGADVPALGVPSQTPDAQALADVDPGQKGTVDVPTEEPGQHAAARAVAGLDTADGLETTLFAAEPLMYSPSNIDVDHRGRVWVCEIVNYRHFRNEDNPVRESGDRILVLQDTTGDGVLNHRTTFYEGRDIDSPHGVCVLPEPDGTLRVIVSAGEHVFNFYDTDGDLRADRKEVMFSGISGVQHDHGIHSFLFGPDGKLYFNFGNEGKQLKDADGNPVVDVRGNEINDSRNPYQQGMVFRCNLDGSNVETLGWNFRNNWELAVDSFGSIWQSDNDDDGNRGTRMNYVLEYGNYGYRDEITGDYWQGERTNREDEVPLRHWHLNDPGVVPNLAQTGAGSPTGIAVYEGDLLPERFRGQVIHCDAGPNMVRAFSVTPVGAGYTAEMIPMLTGTRDQWFRPSDVCVAPDGSLIIADWYDPGVGGHRMQDVTRGRLFRVAPPGSPWSVPEVDVSTVEGAMAALASPNNAVRYRGHQALLTLDRGHVALRNAIGRAKSSGDDPTRRMAARAMFCLLDRELQAASDGLFGPTGPVLVSWMFEDPDLAIVGIRMARRLLRDAADDVQKTGSRKVLDAVLARRSGHPSAAVRRECCVAIAELPTDVAVPIWATLASQYDGQDRWYLEALGIAARGRWDACLGALQKQAMLPVAFEEGVAAGKPDGESKLSGKAMRDIVWRSRGSRTPALLLGVIRDSDTPATDMPRLLRSFDFLPASPEKTAALLSLAFDDPPPAAEETFVRSEALKRLTREDLDSNPDYAEAAKSRVAQSRGTEQFVDLVERFGLTAVDDIAEQAAAGLGRASVRAAEYLGSLEDRGPLRQLLADDAKAATVLEGLAASGATKATPVMLEVMEDDSRPLAIRRWATVALASNGWGAQELLSRKEDGSLPAALEPAAAGTLREKDFGHVRERLAAAFPAPVGQDARPIPSVRELDAMSGDPRRGRLVFHSNGTCGRCHVVDEIGKNVGPNLSEIGDKLAREEMFTAILYPSAGISHNYESYTVITLAGGVVDGLLVSETDTHVTLRDPDGNDRTVAREDIDLMEKQDISLMPADLQKVMTNQELVDVVEWMQSLRKDRG